MAEPGVETTLETVVSSPTTPENQLGLQITMIGKQLESLPKNSAQMVALSSQQAVLKGQLAPLKAAGATAPARLQLMTPAVAPVSPSSPMPVQDALLGVAAGLALGIGATFLRGSLDDTLISGETVEQIVNARVLATAAVVPAWRKKSRPVVISVSDPTSQPADPGPLARGRT